MHNDWDRMTNSSPSDSRVRYGYVCKYINDNRIEVMLQLGFGNIYNGVVRLKNITNLDENAADDYFIELRDTEISIKYYLFNENKQSDFVDIFVKETGEYINKKLVDNGIAEIFQKEQK